MYKKNTPLAMKTIQNKENLPFLPVTLITYIFLYPLFYIDSNTTLRE